MFLMSGLFVLVTPVGMASMGLGPFVTLLSAISFAAVLVASATAVLNVRRAAAEAAAAGPDAEAGAESSTKGATA
jgi:hypothetical protein